MPFLSRRAVLTLPLLTAGGGAVACERTVVATLRLRIVEGFPVVSASLAGRAVSFIVDTGAQGMLVVPAVAEALGLPLRGMAPVFGTGGARQARLVLLPGLRLGDVPMPETLAPVAPLPIELKVEPVLAGLLGASLLSRFDVGIDAPGGRLVLAFPSDCAAPVSGTRVALEVSRAGEPFVPVRVNGQTLLALLDTGSRATILTASAAARLGVSAPASANVASGVDGARQSIGHTQVRLALGAEAAVDTPISISDLQLERGDLLLGMDALLRRSVWLSYARREVIFGAPSPPP